MFKRGTAAARQGERKGGSGAKQKKKKAASPVKPCSDLKHRRKRGTLRDLVAAKFWRLSSGAL